MTFFLALPTLTQIWIQVEQTLVIQITTDNKSVTYHYVSNVSKEQVQHARFLTNLREIFNFFMGERVRIS